MGMLFSLFSRGFVRFLTTGSKKFEKTTMKQKIQIRRLYKAKHFPQIFVYCFCSFWFSQDFCYFWSKTKKTSRKPKTTKKTKKTKKQKKTKKTKIRRLYEARHFPQIFVFFGFFRFFWFFWFSRGFFGF